MVNSINIKTTKLCFWALLGLGVFLRLYKLGAIPFGLNADEASIGYEAFSLLKAGTDRWGIKLPPYFLSFGSGQNTMYAYLSVPFLYFFDLSQSSIRYLAAFLGVLTIPLVNVLAKKIMKNWHWATAGTLLYLFDPYHFMISRWALEYNILPFFVLLSLMFFINAFDKATDFNFAKKISIIFSLPSLALIIYTYASAIFIIPLFVLLILIFFWNEIQVQKMLFFGSLAVFALFISPFLLFILKNHIFKSELAIEQFLPFEIPQMLSNREEVFKGIGKNLAIIKKNFVFIFSGFKEFDRAFNTTKFYLPHYFILFGALTFVYLIKAGFQHKSTSFKQFGLPKSIFIILFWALACFVPFLFFEMNLNRSVHLQAIIPLFSIVGIKLVYDNLSAKSYKYYLTAGLGLLFIVQSTLFFGEYFSRFKGYDQFTTDFDKALKMANANRLPAENVAITSSLVFNYLFVGFYEKIPPAIFQKTLKADFSHPNVAVHSFGGYYMLGDMANEGYYLNAEVFQKLKTEKSFLAILTANEKIDDYKINDISLISNTLYSVKVLFKYGNWQVVRYLKK